MYKENVPVSGKCPMGCGATLVLTPAGRIQCALPGCVAPDSIQKVMNQQFPVPQFHLMKPSVVKRIIQPLEPDHEVRGTGPVSQGQRRRIYKRDNYECCICGTKSNLSIDHLIPRSRGGDNRDDNLITMCVPHNNEKSDNTLEEKGWTIRDAKDSRAGWEGRTDAPLLPPCPPSAIITGNGHPDDESVDTATDEGAT